jgi:predicted nucleotidyltransferase component of viral defense system
MISPDSQTLSWIQDVSAKQAIPDKVLLEKTIRALILLECLVAEELPFVFKGGTALMLLLESRKRLSIDIDIIMQTTPRDLGGLLRSVAVRGGFTRIEEQTRESRSGLRKAHYKFWYAPSYVTQVKEDYVLLDVVFEPLRYLMVQSVPISSPLILMEGDPSYVSVPSLEDILGDKLTAFAPNTTGIPYFKGAYPKGMEIMKQLFDIGCLFDLVEDLGRTRGTFIRFAEAELGHRGLEDQKFRDVLDDIVETSYCVSLRGIHEAENFVQLQTGIRRVQSFIFSENYHLDKAIVHAAKAAYLAKAILHEGAGLNRFDRNQFLGETLITDPRRNKLNKLKKSNIEAFYYWHQALGPAFVG